MDDLVARYELMRAAARAAVVELEKAENDEVSAAVLKESWEILEPFFRKWVNPMRRTEMESVFSAARKCLGSGQGTDRTVTTSRIRRALLLEHPPESDRRKWARRFLGALEYAATERIRKIGLHPGPKR